MINPEIARQSIASVDCCIPAKPDIIVKIQKLLKESDQLWAIADLLARDPGLSSAVLNHINSSFYFMRKKVADIRQATILLGTKRIERLCYYYSLRQTLSVMSTASLDEFWLEAENTARFSVMINQALDLRLPEEDLYTVGLFHDCGIPVMAQMFEDYETLIHDVGQVESSLSVLEMEHYGINHAIVSYQLTEEWGLPETICTAVLQHHEHDIIQSDLPEQQKHIMAVIVIAENIAHQITYNRLMRDWAQHEAWITRHLGLSSQQLAELQHNLFLQAEK